LKGEVDSLPVAGLLGSHGQGTEGVKGGHKENEQELEGAATEDFAWMKEGGREGRREGGRGECGGNKRRASGRQRGA